MASTSEIGNIKNNANELLIIGIFQGLGTRYAPSNPDLLVPNLIVINASSTTTQDAVNTHIAPNTVAINARDTKFDTLSPNLSKLRRLVKATQGVTAKQIADLDSLLKLFRGQAKKTKSTDQPIDPAKPDTSHSSAHTSFDRRTDTVDLIANFLDNLPHYATNEPGFSAADFHTLVAELLALTAEVVHTYVPLNSARSLRDNTMYADGGAIDIFNSARQYGLAITDKGSPEYKAIMRIKFTKPRKR